MPFTVIYSFSNIFLNWINSLVLSDASNLAKNSLREGITYFGKDNGKFKELLIFEFWAKETI